MPKFVRFTTARCNEDIFIISQPWRVNTRLNMASQTPHRIGVGLGTQKLGHYSLADKLQPDKHNIQPGSLDN